MTTINVLEAKLKAMDGYYSQLLEYREYPQDKLENDPTLKGALERYLYLLCQSAIDLGEALIALKSFYQPGSYAEIFQTLKEKGIISPELTQKLIKMTGFRNAIIHDYQKFDFGIAYQVLMAGIDDIKEFELTIKKYLNL
jgi:uncharacterized protein YutE (UPF0331/DUF86 family)